MSGDGIKLLVAGSADSAAAIARALEGRNADARMVCVDSGQAAQHALGREDWQLVFSDLELTDCTAADLAAWLADREIDAPLVVMRDTGADEVVFRCVEHGASHFVDRSPASLQALPRLIDALLAQAGRQRARRQAEKRLIEREERFLDVFDNTSDLIQCVAPSGNIIYTNRAWRRTLGYSEEEARSLTLTDVLHPDSQLCCQDRFRRLLNGESLNRIEFKFVSRSGDPVYLVGDCGSIIREGGVVSTRGIFRDVTDTVKAEQARRLSEARYRALYENAPDIFTIVDARGQVLEINQTGADMLGYAVDELVGESHAKVVHPEDQAAVFECVERYFADPHARADIEYRKIRKDGSVFWVHQRATLDPGEGERRLLVVCRDITDKRYLEDKLAFQASHDALTGLINRREFERRFHQLLARDSGPGDRHALCFLDLDRFKHINDSCGHVAGDELLRQVAALLKGLVRTRDTLARIGGDEFAILLEYISLDKALQLAEKIRAALEAFEFHWRAQRFAIGVSIGVVPMEAGQSLADSLNGADMACYAAKKAGRNRIQVGAADTR